MLPSHSAAKMAVLSERRAAISPRRHGSPATAGIICARQNASSAAQPAQTAKTMM